MDKGKSSEHPNPQSEADRIERDTLLDNEGAAFADRIKRSDRWMIALTAVVGVAGIISAVIFGKQLQVMKMQLDEMHSSASQVNRSIDAATRLASAAEQQIAIARDTEHNDQRAYIVLDPQEPKFRVLNPSDQRSMVVDITIKNSGRTPATFSHAWGDIELVDAGHRRGRNLIVLSTNRSVVGFSPSNIQVIAQGQILVSSVSIQKLSVDEVADIRSERKNILVIGGIRYRDIFGIQHETDYCEIGKPGDLVMCPDHNKAT